MRELFAEALPRLFERPRLVRLLAVLDGGGEETRIVGGSVRNALIGRPVSDFDCATTALPDEVMRRASAAGFKAVPTGFDDGTVTVVVEGEPFEVTTLREDVETDGRHAVVRFGRNFAADARRRDFTINALSLGADGRLHDYAGGVDDLSAGRVRFIGDPGRASGRTFCASCASSASMPATRRGRPTRRGLLRLPASAPASACSRRSGCAPSS